MALIHILMTGLGRYKPRVDLGLVLGAFALIASGAFVYSARTRGQDALRVEIADLNIRQAASKNEYEELSTALVRVTARVAALEQEAVARELPGIPGDVLETGSVAETRPVQKPRRSGPRTQVRF